MDLYRAKELAKQMAAFYPGRSLTAQNITVWIDDLRRLDEEVALRAVARVRTTLPDPPSAAKLREIIRAVSGEYDYGVQGARPLPSPKPTPEEREASLAFFRKLRADFYARHPDRTLGGPDGLFAETPEERIERLRGVARKPVEPDAAEVEAKRAFADLVSGPKFRGGCSGSGKLVVTDTDGKRVCPDCGAEIEDIVVRVPKKRV